MPRELLVVCLVCNRGSSALMSSLRIVLLLTSVCRRRAEAW